MKRILPALAVLGLSMMAVAPAHADKFTATAQATQGQKTRMNRGVPVVQSTLESSLVRITTSVDPWEDRGSFQILVTNGGEESFDVGTENITAVMEDGSTVRIIPYAELAKEAKKKKGGGMFSSLTNLVGDGMKAAAAAGYGGELAKLDKVRQKGDAFLGESADKAENVLNLDELLVTTTVDPGDSFGGTVMFELSKKAEKLVEKSKKKPVPMKVKVNAGSEEHVFTVMLQRAK